MRVLGIAVAACHYIAAVVAAVLANVAPIRGNVDASLFHIAGIKMTIMVLEVVHSSLYHRV
jgi:hypothetical protein